LFVALAEHSRKAAAGIDVVDVKAAQLADSYSRCVEHLHDQAIPQCQWITLLRTGIRGIHGVDCLVLPKHRWQGSASLWRAQPDCWIVVDQTVSQCPCGERLHRGRAPRQRRSRCTRRGLTREPCAQDRQCEPPQLRLRRSLLQEREERPKIADVSTASVLGPPALQRQVLLELLENCLAVRIHSPTVPDTSSLNA